MKRIKEIEQRVKEVQSIELQQVYGKPHVYSDCEYLLEKLKRAISLLKSSYGFLESYDNVGIVHAEVRDFLKEMRSDE